jgi:hypothetical protein
MHLLVFSTDRDKCSKLLQATTSMSSDVLTLDLFNSLESFFEHLRQPIPPNTAALIVARDRRELRKLLPLSDFLWDLRMIVAVPDEKPETLELARRFRPRYVASGDDDFSNVAAVLKKMAKGQKSSGSHRKETIEAKKLT